MPTASVRRVTADVRGGEFLKHTDAVAVRCGLCGRESSSPEVKARHLVIVHGAEVVLTRADNGLPVYRWAYWTEEDRIAEHL